MLVTQIFPCLSRRRSILPNKFPTFYVSHRIHNASMSAQLALVGRRIVIVGCSGSGKVFKGVVLTDFVEYVRRTVGHNSRVTAFVPGHPLPSTILEEYTTRHITPRSKEFYC